MTLHSIFFNQPADLAIKMATPTKLSILPLVIHLTPQLIKNFNMISPKEGDGNVFSCHTMKTSKHLILVLFVLDYNEGLSYMRPLKRSKTKH